MASDLLPFPQFADLLPEPMLLVRPDGMIQAANHAFAVMAGRAPAETAGRNLADFTSTPADAVAQYLRRCAGVADFLPGTLTLRRPDGTEVSCRAEGAALKRSDSRERLVVVRLSHKESAVARFVDLTQKIGDLSREIVRRRRAEEVATDALERERRVRERLTALTDASGTLVSSLARDDVLLEIGRLAGRLIPADALAVWYCEPGTADWRAVWHQGLSESFVTTLAARNGAGDRGAPLVEPLFIEDVEQARLVADRLPVYIAEGIRSLLLIPLRIDAGSYGTVAVYYRQPTSMSSDDFRVAAALCNYASSALRMATLYHAESVSRVAAQAAEQRAIFLAKASAALASSLDYEATLKTVAHLAVPDIADWCAVAIVTDAGELKPLAVAHPDPAKRALAERLHDRYPPDEDSPYGAPHVMRTATSVMMSRISDDLLATRARDPEHLQLLRTLGFTSYMCVPLAIRGRAIGVLVLVSAESGREYSESDLRLAEAVAARAALAVENARAYDEAQQASRVKDEFLATLSHELRTPLNAVLGYARMIRSGMLTVEKHAKAVEVLERNAVALNQIVEDILDVSRIVAGKMRLNMKPVELSALLQDAIATVRPAADAKGVHIETAIDPAGLQVSGDPDRLQQVVWNLLSNAVKFTPPNGRVLLRLEAVDWQVAIVVSDTGEGINREFLPRIFERFSQGNSGFAREHGGLGLGLAIARHIVEMHGGTIAVASEGDGLGATFTVRLPLLAAQRDRLADRLERRDTQAQT